MRRLKGALDYDTTVAPAYTDKERSGINRTIETALARLTDPSPCDFREEPFDLVKPARACGRKVESEPWMCGEPSANGWCFVRAIVVEDKMNRQIRRGTFTSVAALERAISEYLAAHNESVKPFVWTATADSIFDKIVHTYSTNS
jgi:hypothetical protein